MPSWYDNYTNPGTGVPVTQTVVDSGSSNQGYAATSGNGQTTANILNGVGSALNGLGGGSGIGDIINALEGNTAPKSVTYVSQAPATSMLMPVLLIGGIILVVYFLMKKKK